MRKIWLFIKRICYLIGLCAKESPKMILIDGFFGIVVAMQSLLYIIIPKLILDALIYDKDGMRAILLIVALGVGEAIAEHVLAFISDLAGVYNEKVAHDLLLRLSEKATRVNYGAMRRHEVIDKYQQAQNATFGLENKVAVLLCDFFSNIVKFVTIFAVVSTVSGWMALIIVVLVFAKMFVMDRANDKDMALRIRDNSENVHYGYVTELCQKLTFAKEVRTYNLKPFVLNKFENSKNRKLEIAKERIRVGGISAVLESFMDMLMLAAAYVMIIVRYIKGAVSISIFSVYLTAVSEAYHTISEIMRVGVLLRDTNRQVEQYIEFMDFPEQTSLKQSDGSVGVVDKPLVVEFRNVSFKYPGTDNYVLKNVSVKFSPGSKIGIVGENGAGKSTFINLLLRFYDVEEGEILLNGKNIKEIDYDEYMKLFSIVPQNYALFFFDIYENIAFDRKDDKRCDSALNKVGMLEKVEGLTWKKNTFMSKWFAKGCDFSGGEKQRFAIARSFFNEAPIMIMDEPNAAIDPLAEKKINDSIKAIGRDKLVISISHRLSMTKDCDMILVFEDGEIKEKGTHAELIELGGVYREAFYTQARHYISEAV
ncbi:MAG: ABC transporter ATP-binding protein [Lachnospiraceae bacterium]|nr:ABC transporter ATP-binding protein [Lachnospiraceae bacterium]